MSIEDTVEEVEFTYKTRFESGRFKIVLNLNVEFINYTKVFNKTTVRTVKFLVDTGATHTIIPAHLLGLDNFDKFKRCFRVKDQDAMKTVGFNEAVLIDYYNIWIETLDINGIKLRKFIVDITFDPNVIIIY